MLRSAAAAIIQRGLGFRSDLSSDITTSLQQAQRLLELGRSLPRFLIQKDQSLAITSGSAEISLPTGFIRVVDNEGIRLTDSSTSEIYFLENLPYDTGVIRFAEVDDGKPQAYSLRSTTLKIYPDRDKAYTGTWSYYKGADLLTTDIENGWLANAPDALIGRAGMLIAEDLKNEAALGKFSRLYKEAWAGMFAEDELRKQADRPLRLGGRL
jgi:hypothetical protein